MDSDGDGRTNGQELGDPSCVWTEGAFVEKTGLSHPGKCYRDRSSGNSTVYGPRGHSWKNTDRKLCRRNNRVASWCPRFTIHVEACRVVDVYEKMYIVNKI